VESTGSGISRSSRGKTEDLYWGNAAGALRLAYLLTGDRELAEDLAQDAFVRVFGRFQHLREPAAFETYLRRTILNLSKDHFRKLRIERAYLARERSQASPERGHAGEVERRDELLRALHRLPHRQRAAVVLRYCEDLPAQEAAAVLGISVGAVKSLVNRALKTLRSEMGDNDDD
jgi:RNA polymerase sigma-70 factor (sigma-E family)